MPLPEDVKRQFDEAADRAREEFERNWESWSIRDLADWWHRWCREGGTNHDRLGRILMDVTGVRRIRREFRLRKLEQSLKDLDND